LGALSDRNETQTILSASKLSRTGLSASLRRAFDFVKRWRVFQRGYVAEFFAEIGGAHNAALHFCVSRFWYVADENDFTWSERFGGMGCERVF
jgi:hypothetical protein